MLDVITLAALYTLRIIAGAAAARVEASFWLLYGTGLAVLWAWRQWEARRHG